MKKLSMYLIIVFIIISFSFSSFAAETEGVWFYSGYNGGGTSYPCYAEGDYPEIYPNNAISSIYINYGYTIQLFDGSNFTDSMWLLSCNDSLSKDFRVFGADNVVSSFKIRYGVTLYEHIYYGGKASDGFGPGWYDFIDFADKGCDFGVSSISIPKGWSVYLYDGSYNHLGTLDQMDFNSENLDKFNANDKLSFMYVSETMSE